MNNTITEINRYQAKREQSMMLAASFQRLGIEKQAQLLMECGTFLGFAVLDNGDKKLLEANFCKGRLCPMCGWRRSMTIFSNTSRILDYIDREQGAEIKYLFLTLTVRNVSGDTLGETFDMMAGAWQRLKNNRAWQRRVLGAMRTLEVTYNHQDDTYHPHYHMILAVPKDYGKKGDKLYWDQETWVAAWRKAARLDYNPMISIERVKGQRAKGVAEVAKYAVKSSDYLISGDERRTDQVVSVLHKHLKGRRLVGYSGILRSAQRALKIEDPEEGELTDNIRGDVGKLIIRYRWSAGLGCYVPNGEGTTRERNQPMELIERGV